MRHIGKLTRDSVWFNDVPFIILIPGFVNHNKVAVHIAVHEVVQVHKHPILIGSHVPAVLVEEVQYHLPVFIDGIIVRPIASNQLQALSIIENIACQLLAILPTCRMEVDEKVNDAGKEILC